jgi:hypothetical protein
MRRLFVLALAALGCVPEFDDNLSTITTPRLLAIQATPAEAKQRAETTLRALVAGPDSESAEPRFALCLARKPLTELGPINPDCLTLSGESVQDLGRGSEVTAAIPADACRLFGPAVPPPKAGEPPARPVDPDPTGGFYQPVLAHFGGEFSLGTVRLDCGVQRASTEQLLSYNAQYRPNENPRVAKLVHLDDDAEITPGEEPSISVKAGTRVSLRASWDACPSEPECGDGICGAYEDRANCPADCGVDVPKGCTGAEPYVWYDFESFKVAPRREGIRVAWYASAGSFEEEQTGREEGDAELSTSNVWRTPARSGIATLWLVIRDSRGGVSWETYRVEVRE